MNIKLGLLLSLSLIAVIRLSAQAQNSVKMLEFEDFGCEELKLRTEKLLLEVANNPGSTGYIIGYDGRYRRFNRNSQSSRDFVYSLPRTNELTSRLDLIKKQLKFLLGTLPWNDKNYIFVNGGVREHLTIEYFVVPKGAKPPAPTPALKKIRHVPGRVRRLSLGDC